MDLVTTLPAFVLAVVLISASPGPAMALVLRRAALAGWRGAVPTVIGLEVGLYLWALMAAAGFAALVAASEVAYVVLRVLGATVLLYLGLRYLRGAWRMPRTGVAGRASADTAETGAGETDAGDPGGGWRRTFGEGLVVQLANPKAAIFMMSFYPQFVPSDRPLFATTAALALLQVAIETALYVGLAVGVARAGSVLRRSAVRRRIEAVTGTVMVALGVRVALAQR